MVFIKTAVNSVFFFLILSFAKGFTVEEKCIYYPRYVHEVTEDFIKRVEEEYGFLCYATGGSMPTDIRSINVKFSCSRNATIAEARELLVSLTEKFREIIDRHEKIRPFLREYPFPPTRIIIGITFESTTKSQDLSPAQLINYVSCIKGDVYYDKRDEQTRRLVDIKKEPYETALNIVRNSGK